MARLGIQADLCSVYSLSVFLFPLGNEVPVLAHDHFSVCSLAGQFAVSCVWIRVDLTFGVDDVLPDFGDLSFDFDVTLHGSHSEEFAIEGNGDCSAWSQSDHGDCSGNVNHGG